MSLSINNENTESIKKGSLLKQCNKEATYNWYSSKYDNMLVFLEGILNEMENPEDGLHSWLSKLKKINFDLFLTILEKQLEDNGVDEVIQNFADDEGFNLDSMKSEDLHKIKRYITLFKSMF